MNKMTCCKYPLHFRLVTCCIAFLTACMFPDTALTAPLLTQNITISKEYRIDSGSASMRLAAGENKVEQGASAFVQDMADKGIDFLDNDELTVEQKKNRFRVLLKDSFDMRTIGRFALGRYWRVATEKQRNEYLRLFKNMVIEVYAKRFSEYKGQGFEVTKARADGERDAIVTSFVIPKNEPKIQVDWRVRYKNGRYQIVDIIVEGVSMSVTQRSDFSSVIQRGGGNVQVLLDHMKKQQPT